MELYENNFQDVYGFDFGYFMKTIKDDQSLSIRLSPLREREDEILIDNFEWLCTIDAPHVYNKAFTFKVNAKLK